MTGGLDPAGDRRTCPQREILTNLATIKLSAPLEGLSGGLPHGTLSPRVVPKGTGSERRLMDKAKNLLLRSGPESEGEHLRE